MTPIDPRYYEMNDELRVIEMEIVKGKDELQILQKQQRIQTGTLKRLNNNPQMEDRIDQSRTELAEIKQTVKQQEKELKEISSLSQQSVEWF